MTVSPIRYSCAWIYFSFQETKKKACATSLFISRLLACYRVCFCLNTGWFWGDPHIKTLDGGNYTFNGLGEYVMIDAQNSAFQLQARTGPAQGDSTNATIFTAGAAKEHNSSTVEVRVKKGGQECIKAKMQCHVRFSSPGNIIHRSWFH